MPALRYEFNAPPYDADNRMRIFDLNTLQLQQVGTNGVPRSGLQSDFNNVAPRVGMSWDVTGNGKLLVRGGYGIFYDSGTLIENSALYFNPPYWTLAAVRAGHVAADARRPVPVRQARAAAAIDQHDRSEFPHRLRAGSNRRSRACRSAASRPSAPLRDVARQRPGAQAQHQPAGARPGLARLRAGRSTGSATSCWSSPRRSSTYHALELTAQRRPSRGLSFRAAYTLSNSMDDTSAFLATDGDDNTPQDSRNLAAEWGPSDYDVRQRLVLSATYEVPRRSRVRWLRALAGERRLHRAVRPAVHAAGQLRQQQHRQRRRRHVRLRSPERHHHARRRRRHSSATTGQLLRDRAAIHVRQCRS